MRLLLFMLLLPFVGTAQQFRVTDVVEGDDKQFHFPVVEWETKKVAAQSINQKLQQELLSGPLGADHRLLREFQADDFNYTVVGNSLRFVSFDFVYGYCGAGCHYNWKALSFDANTGAAIVLDQLMTPSGIEKAKAYLLAEFRKKVAVLAKKNQDMYGACLEEWKANSGLDFDRWALTNNGIRFWGGWCLDGSSWQADEARMYWDLPIEQIFAWLTPYGLKLFLGGQPSPGSFVNRVMHGSVDGKYPITLLILQPTINTYAGSIIYDKYGTPIKLSVEVLGTQVTLHELNDQQQPTSTITCVWDGQKLSGTFKNLKSGKMMPFTAGS